jgi:predicted GH43/DUF377 family glycosyl hydrolase
VELKRTDIILKPNNTRVLFRPFQPMDPNRAQRIVGRVMQMPEDEVERVLELVLSEFHGRHQKLLDFFITRYDHVRERRITDTPVSRSRQLLIGAYFTHEYSLESAALFNPSMVWHPNQSGLPAGSKRFVLSLRATGEGHVSSITFRSGVVDSKNQIHLDKPTRFVTAPEAVANAQYEKVLFHHKLVELGLGNGVSDRVLALLGDEFTLNELNSAVATARRQSRQRGTEFEAVISGIVALAKSNYEITFSPEQNLSECAIFPYSPTETNGIEDARFVQFREDDGRTRYYATYTAFDGKVVLPQMLETDDFRHFQISTLNGPEVMNKGFALFPRKINGMYAMLSRQDGENIYLMYSEMLHFWYTKQLILMPTFPWEFVQVGNCGPPIETEAGWLVLSHGVGPMRKYSMGAFLLDLQDPSRVIGRLSEPLLAPNETEREGYVPNVIYSCGGVIHNGELIIPYAMSDFASTFATVSLKKMLSKMLPYDEPAPRASMSA